MNRYVLGVHSGHDSSACLFCDCRMVMAIERERLTRKKHDSGEPIECIEYILDANGLDYSDIDLVVRVNWYNSAEKNDDYYSRFKNVLIRYEHHLFHAYSVSITMDNPGIIYVIDGRGCRPTDNNENGEHNVFETESVYFYDGTKISFLEKTYEKHYSNAYIWGSHMNSIGYIYADVSRLIFQDYNAAGKIMALASYGKKNDDIPKVIEYENNTMAVSKKWLEYLNSQPYPLDYNTQIAKDISYSLQCEVEKYIKMRVDVFIEKYKSRTLALCGGVALNCKNNGELFNHCDLEKLYLFPACGDNGIAVGAAVWGIRNYFKDNSKLSWKYDLGKKYGQVCYSQESIQEAVKLLYEGNVIGIFENGSEFGPRALCNRSLLALPSYPGIKNYLNSKIKHREWFRPFGGVMLERNISKLTDDRIPNDNMLVAIKVKKDWIGIIPDLVHVDETVRVQIIRQDRKNSTIYRILEELERKYGEFILINTSFNGKGEPIVETPDEAKKTALEIGIEYIILNGRVERIMR